MMKNLSGALYLTLVVALLPAAACAQGRSDQAASASDQVSSAPPPAEAAAPQVQKQPLLSPRGGAPGTKVAVSMTNLLLGDSVEVGFGSFVEHQILAQGQVDEKGAFATSVTVPAGSPPGPYYFFIAHKNGSPMSVSDPFLVTRADGTVRLRGQVSNATGPCPAIKGLQDETYTLLGKVGTITAGARVTVEATLAPSSTCPQGLPVEVKTIQVDP